MLREPSFQSLLRLGTVAAPAPAGVVPSGIPQILALTAAPGHGAWKSVIAASEPAAAEAPASSSFPAYDTAGTPRFGYDLEFLGALTVQLRAEVLGHTPQGFRINFFVVHGEAHGPRLRGRVRPEGGDWMCIRPD